MGCWLFIPVAKKFGRRPVYIASMALMTATIFWSAKIQTLSELYATNLLSGLAGATNEAIVQITISDLFFVHHRGGMNGLYMIMVMIGSFLTPMAAGYQATVASWRASYMTMGIFCAILFVLFTLCYEETKYAPMIDGVRTSDESSPNTAIDAKTTEASNGSGNTNLKTPETTTEATTLHHEIDWSIPMNPWWKRLALVTPSSESIWPYYYRPWMILLSFPHVMFTSLQYATAVMWLSIMSSVLSIVMSGPPYMFVPADIGYMCTGPFVGSIIGALYGGFLGDRTILYFAKRNKGYYEPEMRLYILFPPSLFICAGLIMYGVSMAKGEHWIIVSVGGAFFGYGLGSISDASLTLVIDSYREITGDAFTAIAFIRNAFCIGIPFAITPWMETNGVQNMFITCGFISLGVCMTIILIAVYGKRIRRRTATMYHKMATEHAVQWR